jgi:hypothetical protein
LIVALVLSVGARAATWLPDDGCRPGSSSDGYFAALGPAQYWNTSPGGWNACYMYTRSEAVQIVNWAEWYLPIDTTYDDTYSLQAAVYSGGYGTPHTTWATYRLWPAGHINGNQATYGLDQNTNQAGYCYIIGSHSMRGSLGGLIDVIDYNGRGDNYVYVDQFCFRGH